jgi:hypothetical protein
MPDWGQEELDALSYALREKTVHRLVVKAVVVRRLENARSKEPPAILRVTPSESHAKLVDADYAHLDMVCKACEKPTMGENVCSNLCHYLLTGEQDSSIVSLRRRGSLTRVLKFALQNLSRKKRKELRVSRSEAWLARARMQMAASDPSE